MRTCCLALLLLSALVLAGCSGTPGAYPVRGKVTLSDGSPLTKGTINFYNEKGTATGDIRSDGTYELGSLNVGDGAVPGKYQVFFSGDALGGGYDNAPQLIDSKYGNASTSGLTAEVKAQTNTGIDFTLDPPAAQ